MLLAKHDLTCWLLGVIMALGACTTQWRDETKGLGKASETTTTDSSGGGTGGGGGTGS